MNRNRKVNLFIKTLAEKKVTLALAESITCGLAAHFLSTCKGTSEVFRGSVVCYHEEVKKKLLKVPAKMIKKYTAESAEVTMELTKGLGRVVEADIHASITGLASDGGSETRFKPVGTVFFSILYKGKFHNSRYRFYGTPLRVREKACLHLYDLISKTVRN